MTRIALIHAVDIAIEPITKAFNELWPETDIIHLWDETLSIERAKCAELTPFLYKRIALLYDLAVSSQVDAIMFTCSAFGSAIEEVAKNADIPVITPNQAMFEQAISSASQVGLLGTFSPAMKGMEKEFLAASNHSATKLSVLCVSEARDALLAGETDKHNQKLLEGAKRLSDSEVIMIAHFSSSIAKSLIEKKCQKTVLSSPECAVRYLKKALSS
ncbi:aspartate/glutamate racemase family protein [Vibrio sonorensis]|uniref:aspartate/glutamate racemase family protein n=1 Tax=Vibrio sonorensis TaxID=1004316 RepID=UPI0008DB0197|nr:aspartate/glutamate racemase family protein [Vibrio sonorensis]